MARPILPLSSNQPDLRVVRLLNALEYVFLALIGGVSGIVFFAWLIPGVAGFLPQTWNLMKLNTAILGIVCAISVILIQSRRSARSVVISRWLAGFVCVVALATLSQYVFGVSLRIDTLLAADAGSPLPGRMSAQAATSFLLLGIALFNVRVSKKPLAYIIDGVTLAGSLMMFIYVAAYAFGAMGLFGDSMQHRLSPQTLFCLILLFLIVFNRRTEYGVFAILVDDGIGGKTARFAAPCALLLPLSIAVIRGFVVRSKLLPELSGVALASATMSLLAFCFVVLLSRRCRRLESATRELSLRDSLTQLYNRRGFYLLAEQGFRLARRDDNTFFLLFIDLDNLKQINDTLGHEFGSARIQEMGTILRSTFRETDVIARIGGDEFLVAGNGDRQKVGSTLDRLQEAAKVKSGTSLTPFPLSFSFGYVTADAHCTETLEELVQQADSIMYESKRKKKQHPDLRDGPSETLRHSLDSPRSLTSA